MAQLKNHTIYYQQDRRVPVTKITLTFVGAGDQKEREEQAGLAAITARMLFHGTSTYSREALQKKFELLGASVSAETSETDFTIRISCFTRNLSEVFSLMHHVIDDVNFPEEELTIVKKQGQNRLISVLQNPEEVLRMANRYVLFERTYLGKFGSLSALSQITQKDLVQFFQKVKSSGILFIYVISDLERDEIERHFLLLTSSRHTDGFSLEPEKEYRRSNGKEVFIVHSENSANDRLLWTHEGLTASDERRYTLSLVLDALGSFEGFLFDQLRNKNGWCYGAYAYLFPPTTRKGRVGYYSDPSDTSSQHLIPRMLELLEAFNTNDDFLQRLAERNGTFKNRYAYQLDLNYKIISAINYDRYGIPILTKEEYFAKIDAVTPESVHQLTADIFDTTNLTMVFYGEADRITNTITSIDNSIPMSIFDKSELIA